MTATHTARHNQAWLTGHGHLTWTQGRALLQDTHCLWMDLDGVHLEPPPEHAPPASHLWAWTTRRLFRIRLDGQDVIAAQLDFDQQPGHPNTERVEISEHLTTSWPSREGRVNVKASWRGRPIRITTVHGLMPLAFAQLTNASNSPPENTG